MNIEQRRAAIAEILSRVPAAADVDMKKRVTLSKAGGQSRREANAEKRSDEARAERRWKKELKKRDGEHCRWCKRKVVDCMERVPERRECHHVSGRVVRAIRWDRRNGIVLCGTCHDRVTGIVAEKVLIVPTKTFTVDCVAYANADSRVTFKRIQ